MSHYFTRGGHDVQQFYQLVADLVSPDDKVSDYIGFFDADAAITAPVFPGSIFSYSSGSVKPHAVGMIGRAQNEYWQSTPPAQAWMLGRPSVMRGMSLFPFVVKRQHLREMRQRLIERHHLSVDTEVPGFWLKWTNGDSERATELSSFSSLFLKWSKGSGNISQFCLIYSWLWYEKRQEYSWHLQPLGVGMPLGKDGWTNRDIAGQIKFEELYADAIATYGKDIFKPFPRIAAHVSYHANADIGRDTLCGLTHSAMHTIDNISHELIRTSLCETNLVSEQRFSTLCDHLRAHDDGYGATHMSTRAHGAWGDPFMFDGPPWKVGWSCKENIVAWEDALVPLLAKINSRRHIILNKFTSEEGLELLCRVVARPLNISGLFTCGQ